ncbi:hypothetical protein [Persicitalea jodogahamensis]
MLTLVFPVLIYLFLKVFTTNHYDLPYFVPLRDVANNAIVQSNGDTTFYQIQDFSLKTADGSTISTASLQGKTIVISTVSSPCADTCKEVLSQLARVQSLHQAYPAFFVLTLVSEDNPQLISSIKESREVEEAWKIATVPDSAFSLILQDVFRLSEKVPGLQTISPQARLSLVDDAGFIRGFYDTTDPEEVDRLMAEIRILEHNRKQD